MAERKCYVCGIVKDLNEKNFCKSKRKKDLWFKYECKVCAFKRLKKNYAYNLKKRLIIKAGYRCERCGLRKKNLMFFDIDHIVPRRRRTLKEPSNIKIKDISNLQVLCPNCHRLKTIEDRRKYKIKTPVPLR